jgi:hypothetical protein
VLRSEEFDNASWSKLRSSILANQVIAPDGTLSADKLIANTDNNTHAVFQTFSLTAATFTVSVYAKMGEYSGLGLFWTEGGNPTATFNLLTGTVSSVGAGVTATITPVGNGWYRCTYTKTNATTGGNPVIRVGQNGSTFTYTGDDYSGIYIWGAQLE